MSSFFSELKRRNVYKVAVAYAVVAWLLIQAASILFPTFEAPPWVMKVVVVIIAIGFPIALIIAWAFEMTPEGMKRTENIAPDEKIPQWSRRKFAALVVSVAVVAGALLLFQLSRNPASNPANPASPERVMDKSIAVLPFASLSEDKANAYFADGIQDEILTRLSKIAELKVISRTSTQQYQSKPGNISEIGKQLGVAHILEGSVQKAGESVRVNVQLIKADGDVHVWAETYDRKLMDVFAVESEVAERIAASLEAKLTGREKQQLAQVPTQNADAYDAYLRGLGLSTSQGEQEIEQSRKFFRRAVDLDPQFALAWAALATQEAFKYFAAHKTTEQLAAAQTAMETAVRLQPESSESHAAAGSFYYYCLQDFDRALAEYKKARELSPSNAVAIGMTGLVKRRQGRLDETVELLLEATGLDPRNTDLWVNLGRSHRGARRFKEARAMLDRALAILPGDDAIIAEKIETYLGEGDLEGAEKILQGIKLDLKSESFENSVGLLVLRRDFAGAKAKLSEHLHDEASPVRQMIARLDLAILQAITGDLAAAQPVLEELRAQFDTQRKQGDRTLELVDAIIDISAVLGDRATVEREAEPMLQATARDRWRWPHSHRVVGRAYAWLGDAGRALPHIEKALEPSPQGLTPAYLRLDPVWDKIRSDARFQKLAGEGP
jgi:TolB-like protein/Tfp pilus assembly protein PilF